MEMNFFCMEYTNFQIGPQSKWLQFYYYKNIQLEKDMFRSSCEIAYQVQPMCKNYKMSNANVFGTFKV
jgi:hypothetical protein